MFGFLKRKKINCPFLRWLNTRRSNIWIVLLIFFSVVVTGIIFFSIIFYFRINANKAFTVTHIQNEGSQLKEINKNDLNNVIRIFEIKTDKFKKIKQEKGTYIIDPSV